MIQINYNLEMETQMEAALPGTPLFLHACCAPCSTTALERLGQKFAITLFYENPNILPGAEYEKRLAAFGPLLEGAKTVFPVKLEVPPYVPARFLSAAKGLEAEPEGGARCRACFALRLSETALRAKQLGFPLFATTLTVSPHKNAALINEIGGAAAEEGGPQYLPSDFKKQDGYRRSVQLSGQYGLYRQAYCGCLFSKTPAESSADVAK